MTAFFRYACLSALVLPIAVLGLSGCGAQNQGRTFTEADNVEHAHDHHEHAHGPHEGHIVELGGEDYHAEVTLDPKTRKLTVYLLASDLKTPLPVEAKSLTVNLKVGDATQEISLAAAPQPNDGEGKASQFTQGEGELPESIHDAEDLQGEVVVEIGGQAHRGAITHDHHHH